VGERVTVTRFDDFDNEIGADEAITYALGGTTYEIDLLDGNARRLLSELEKWIRVSRRVSGLFMIEGVVEA
jgi:Lsr2